MMIVPPVFAALAAASILAVAAPRPDPQVDALKQRIWTSVGEVDALQRDLPSEQRASGPGLQKLYTAKRAPIVDALWRIGASEPQSPRGLQTLGLVIAWGDPSYAGRAWRLAARDHTDDDALAPILEAGYSESAAPDKRAALERLATSSRSKAVTGTSLFLLARETLSDPASSVDRRRWRAALSQLRRVATAYASQPTTLLGAGGSGRLGPAAAGALFEQEHLSVGSLLPAMTARDLEGAVVTSTGFRGRYTLIDFWATWCPPCVAAFPTLAALQHAYGDRLRVVSISADARAATAAAFVKKEGATWLQWHVGPSGAVAPNWSNGSYPSFILVSPAGRIVARSADISEMTKAVSGYVR